MCNDYATTFGGTSHATPTVAGAIALILSARPGLNWIQVRDILRASCVRIDAGASQRDWPWQDLDGDGCIDYSRWYGAGPAPTSTPRSALALDDHAPLADVYVRENLADIGAVPVDGHMVGEPGHLGRQDAEHADPGARMGSAPPHENARRGQDNALFCRVRNRGTALGQLGLRARDAHPLGGARVRSIPEDFEPSTNVGAPHPEPTRARHLSDREARVDNLEPAPTRSSSSLGRRRSSRRRR